MTEQAPKSVAPSHEKTWMQSKKFVAFLVTQLGLFVLLGSLIYTQEASSLGSNVSFMVLAVTAGFIAVGYILGQAYIDKFVRLAQITMGHGTVSLPKPPPPIEEEDN